MVSTEIPVTREAVEQPLTIGVLGTHSTGKSTFLHRLAAELRRRDVTVGVVSDLGEEAMRHGMSILFNHTWASTLWFITRGISNELANWGHVEVVLVDRPVPDALGYYRAALDYRHDQGDPAEMAYLEALVRGHSRRYDLIYRTTLETDLPIGDNKTRNTDQRFRVMADHHVKQVLVDLDIPHEPLPVDGHDEALKHAITFTMARLAGEPYK